MGQSGEPVGLQAHRLVLFKKPPRFGRMQPFRHMMGLLLRESGRRESKALLSGPLGIRAICPASEAAEPRGVRGPVAGAGCHAASEGKNSFCCEYIEIDAEECASCSLRVQAARLRLWSRDCGQSSFSQLKLSENRRKQFISDGAAHCVQSRRQRSLTVRMPGWVGNGEVRAKTTNIRACTSTVT
jgi:hypothetical protein